MKKYINRYKIMVITRGYRNSLKNNYLDEMKKLLDDVKKTHIEQQKIKIIIKIFKQSIDELPYLQHDDEFNDYFIVVYNKCIEFEKYYDEHEHNNPEFIKQINILKTITQMLMDKQFMT